MSKYYEKLPSDENSGNQMLMQKGGVRKILKICEDAEINREHKLINAQIEAYKFQLVCYLIVNDLHYAKYLWKRLPKQLKIPGPIPRKDNNGNDIKPLDNPHVKEAKEFNAIWKIGQALWKEDFSGVYKIISSIKWSKIIQPFINTLEQSHRNRMIELVNKAYTSIKISELNKDYLCFKDSKDVNSTINSNKNWSIDKKNKNVINIDHSTDNVMLNTQLLGNLTKYVCFMEGQQDLEFDQNAKAITGNQNQSSKN